MSEAPLLSEEDIREEVQTLHLRPHRSLSTALRGRGEAGALTLRVESRKEEKRFLVEPVSCELSLRRALWREPQTPKVLLVDGVAALPHDLVGRLAGGEIREVTEARRLARLFGATAASPLLATSPVGHALLEPPAIRPPPIQGSTVDFDTGVRALLWARAALPPDGALSEERLLAFFATHPLPAVFARQLGVDPASEREQAKAGEALRAAIAQYLGERHGQAAVLAFEAWCRGQGERAAALIFVLEAAAGRLSTSSYLRARLVGLLQGIDPQTPDATLARLAGQPDYLKSLASRLHLRLGQDREAPAALVSVLTEADRLLPEAEARENLDESLFLPGSFERGVEKLAQSLSTALEASSAPTPSGVSVQRCQQNLERLSRHALADEPSRKERLERARMAARLVAWLTGSEVDGRTAASLAVEAGLADWALRASGGLAEGALREVVERVRQAAHTRREAMEATFAQTLASSASEAGGLPPEGVLDQVVVPFLGGKPSRRLLLLLVPGLRWADTHELLEHLEQKAQPAQGLLAFRSPGSGGEGGLPLPPLLGGLGVAEQRSRLLAGRQASPGQILDEPRDRQRLREHEGLHAVAGPEGPEYLPAADALLPDGAQKTILTTQITSRRRLVAVGMPGANGRVPTALLLDLLRQASEAGRATLLASCGDDSDAPEASVLPLLLVGSAWLETLAEEADTELQLLPPPRLPFWQLEVPPRAAKPASRPAARPGKPRAQNPHQIPLLDVPPTVPLRLRLEKLFRSGGGLPKPVLDVVEALYEAGGTMSAEDLARKMNLFGPRIGGLVAMASELVSQDGFELLTYDHHARMARLNKPLLNQLLEGTT